VGSTGDALDNALAESQIGLFKSELVWPHGPWRDRDHLEAAVLDWVSWFNTERPHEAIDDLNPVAADDLPYRQRASLAERPADTKRRLRTRRGDSRKRIRRSTCETRCSVVVVAR
jgi:transposase InsO family protein